MGRTHLAIPIHSHSARKISAALTAVLMLVGIALIISGVGIMNISW